MEQWTNLQRTKKFVNPMRLYTTYKKSGGLHLATPGLTVGCLSVWQAIFGWGLKLAVDQNIRFSALFSQGTALFQQL